MQKLNRQELIEIVTKIYNCEYNTEKEGSNLIDIFRKNVPYQDILELLHKNAHLTPEELVEKALAHKPVIIELGGPKYTEDELSRKDKK
jgi:hypothetical protein